MSPALLLIAALGAAPQGELIEFTATWCGPCQNMKPIVARLHGEGLPIRQVDVDRNPELAKQFNITGIPAFVLVVNGQEVAREVGAQDEATLRRLLAKIPAAAATAATSPARDRGWLGGLIGGRDKPKVEAPQFEASSADQNAVVRGNTPPAANPPAETPPPESGSAPRAGKPLETSARIRVTNEKGTDFGSGTIIGSRRGAALVLTCWHIFREFGESADVAVDLFPDGPNGQAQSFPGKLLRHDEKADVAIVAVEGCDVMAVSPIASTDKFPKPGDHVFSVGCGDGKAPTLEQHSVTRLNPYQGPGTTECTGMPVVGRSGGGLFDKAGRVIGVCFAADRADRLGVYVGPEEIHKLLVEANYASLIPAPADANVADVDEPGMAPAPSGTSPVAASEMEGNPFADPAGAPADPGLAGDVAEVSPRGESDLADSSKRTASPAVAEATPSVESKLADGAIEATVILRSLDDNGTPSRVIVINRVSDRFRRYLTGEVGSQTVETALHVPSGRLDRSRLERADLVVDATSETYVRSVASKPMTVASGVAALAGVFNNRR